MGDDFCFCLHSSNPDFFIAFDHFPCILESCFSFSLLSSVCVGGRGEVGCGYRLHAFLLINFNYIVFVFFIFFCWLMYFWWNLPRGLSQCNVKQCCCIYLITLEHKQFHDFSCKWYVVCIHLLLFTLKFAAQHLFSCRKTRKFLFHLFCACF